MVPVNSLQVKVLRQIRWMCCEDLPERNNHYEGVGEVEKCWDKFIDLQLCEEIEDAVQCYIDRRAPGHCK